MYQLDENTIYDPRTGIYYYRESDSFNCVVTRNVYTDESTRFKYDLADKLWKALRAEVVNV